MLGGGPKFYTYTHTHRHTHTQTHTHTDTHTHTGCLSYKSFFLKRNKTNKGMVVSEQEKNMSEMFQFLHLALHFLASVASLTSSNDKTSISKLKHSN